MNGVLSSLKISQRQERKNSQYIFWQNLALPKDFPQQASKAALRVGLTPPAGDIKQPFPPSSSTLPAPPSLTSPSSRPLSADATGRGLPTKGEGRVRQGEGKERSRGREARQKREKGV